MLASVVLRLSLLWRAVSVVLCLSLLMQYPCRCPTATSSRLSLPPSSPSSPSSSSPAPPCPSSRAQATTPPYHPHRPSLHPLTTNNGLPRPQPCTHLASLCCTRRSHRRSPLLHVSVQCVMCRVSFIHTPESHAQPLQPSPRPSIPTSGSNSPSKRRSRSLPTLPCEFHTPTATSLLIHFVAIVSSFLGNTMFLAFPSVSTSRSPQSSMASLLHVVTPPSAATRIKEDLTYL